MKLWALLGLLGMVVAPPPTANPCSCPAVAEYSVDTATVITSPGFASNQICAALNCKYRIFANNGQHVKINFNAFYTFGSLQITNGPKGDETELTLATLKGVEDTTKMPAIFSSIPKNGGGGVVTLIYQASAKTVNPQDLGGLGATPSFGFNLTFTSTSDNGCGPSQIKQSLFGPAVTIQSPNYPFNYPPDLNCRWNFTAPTGKLAQIVFNSDAQTESDYDDVVISRGDGSQPISYSGNYGSGGGGPNGEFAPVKGANRGLMVTFSSDDDIIYKGFKATLSGFTPPNQCDCGRTVYYLTDVTSCLQIRSPNFGPGHSGYCPNANCTYNLIVADTAYRARISFDSFELETGYDHLTIIDGINGFQLEDCTGTVCSPRTSDDNKLTLNFKTDSSIGKDGYSAQFCAVLPA